jgi:hypothetical protein
MGRQLAQRLKRSLFEVEDAQPYPEIRRIRPANFQAVEDFEEPFEVRDDEQKEGKEERWKYVGS